MANDIFGGITCLNGSTNDTGCLISAKGLHVIFNLQLNSYVADQAKEWEIQVYIRNMISFNYALTGKREKFYSNDLD